MQFVVGTLGEGADIAPLKRIPATHSQSLSLKIKQNKNSKQCTETLQALQKS